jgi:predicted negative regulator of RcsB-dependent stress response
VVVLAAGAWFFMKARKQTRLAELNSAMKTYNSMVGVEPNTQMRAFSTEEERQQAIEKDLGGVATRHAGTEEGAIASYLLGLNAADQGKLDDSVKHLKAAVQHGGRDYGALARLALAEVYAAQGNADEAEKLLREVIAKPSILAGKDQAALNLARILSKSKPDEARKLLEPLRTETGAASRAAISLMAELSQAK